MLTKVRPWVALGLVCLGLIPTRATGQSVDVYQLYALGRVDSVIHLLEQKSRADTAPLAAEQRLLLGLAYARNNELGKAAHVLGKVWGELPGDRSVGLALAEVYERAGRLPLALRVLWRLEEEDSTAFPVLSRLGVVNFKLGDVASAWRIFDKLGRLYPRRAGVQIWRARCALKMDSVETACEAYRRAVQLDSLNTAAWLGLARVLFAQDSLKAASWAAERGLKISPRHPQLHRLNAEILQGLEQFEKAVVEFLEAQALGDHSAELFQKLGNCYYALGKFDKAKEAFSRSVALKPGNPVSAYGLGLCYKREDSLAQAAGWFRTALELSLPDYLGELYFQLGDCSAQLGDVRGAVALFRKALEYGASRGVVYYALATTYDRSYRDKRPALRAFEKALRYGGLSPEAVRYARERVERLRELVHFQQGRSRKGAGGS